MKREAEKLEQEKLFLQARIERKKRLQQEEARRLELEWLEQEREALREPQVSR